MIIDRLTKTGNIVLATGGGAVKSDVNCRHIQNRSTVIYLRASVSEQLKRTARDRKRPLLHSAEPEAVLHSMAKQRTPIYARLADYTFDTDNKAAQQVVNEILSVLRNDNTAD